MPSPTHVLITFCVGVAATLAWQSYGDAARQNVANAYPQLGWLAPRLEAQAAPSPDQQRLKTQHLIAELEGPSFISRTVAQRRLDGRYS